VENKLNLVVKLVFQLVVKVAVKPETPRNYGRQRWTKIRCRLIFLHILLYMCPHTAMYVCPHTAIYVLSCCYMCPHTAIYVSSYCYICVVEVEVKLNQKEENRMRTKPLCCY
jgi:hypothetical protein